MSPYIFVCMPLLLVALFSYKKEVSSGILIFLFVPLFLLSAMRYDIGRDYSTYMLIFENPDLIGVNEKGYMLINNFAIQHGLTLQFVIIIYSMLTLLFAFIFISENSKNKILSLFIFYTYTPFYLQTLNTLRQALAIYIFLYATKYIHKKNFLAYTLYILFAAVFAHNSVIVVLPLYFLLDRKYSNIIKCGLIACFIAVSSLLEFIVQSTPYAIYLLGDSGAGGFSPVFLMDILLCALVVFFQKKTNYIYSNITFFSLCILSMGVFLKASPIFTIVSRINEYFLASLVISISSRINDFRKYKKLLYYASICCFFSVFYFSLSVNGLENQLVPYQTFFNVFHNDIYFDILMIINVLMFALNMLIYAMRRKAECILCIIRL